MCVRWSSPLHDSTMVMFAGVSNSGGGTSKNNPSELDRLSVPRNCTSTGVPTRARDKPRFLIVWLMSCVLARFNADSQAQRRCCNHGQRVDDGEAQCRGGGWVPKRLICRCRCVSSPYDSFQSCTYHSYPRRQHRRCSQRTGRKGRGAAVATCPCASSSTIRGVSPLDSLQTP